MVDHSEVWSKGSLYGPNDSEMYTAGINVESGGKTHRHAIELFGNSADGACMRRDLILLAINQLTFVKVV
jgi:hypothetical protein